MSKSSYPLKLPQSIKEAAQWLAEADGVSLNQTKCLTLILRKATSCPDKRPY